MNRYIHEMNLDLSSKNALVCGSSRGIGKAAAIELASLGANVTLVSRSAQLMEKVLLELPNLGNQVHDSIVMDLSDHQDVENKMNSLLEKKQIHILINNTGGPAPGPAYLADPASFLTAFNQHLISNQIISQALIPGMKLSGYGRIINVISTSVKQPLDGLGVSNTIRGAVANWAKTLANELGQTGITVNNVLPGATSTERLSQIILNKSQKSGLSISEVEMKMKSSIPAGRFGKPEEIGAAIAFLASPAAAYINGTNLVVDGGRTKSL
jgi:3-oxoacyl-[acyl-carrier protein] reductase